jgi:hypothetical protein
LFCPNVEWLKNRGITLGCSLTAYCPGDAVSRLAMAAFMNRLGTALTPMQMTVAQSPGTVDLDASAVFCQSAAFAVTAFPRRALIDATFDGYAMTDVGLAASAVYSFDGGATWINAAAHAKRDFVRSNAWSHIADLGVKDLNVGDTIRFGVRASRDGLPGTADLSDSRCQLRVLIFSRDGTSSPY